MGLKFTWLLTQVSLPHCRITLTLGKNRISEISSSDGTVFTRNLEPGKWLVAITKEYVIIDQGQQVCSSLELVQTLPPNTGPRTRSSWLLETRKYPRWRAIHFSAFSLLKHLHGSCCPDRPCGCWWSVLLLETMWMSVIHATMWKSILQLAVTVEEESLQWYLWLQTHNWAWET